MHRSSSITRASEFFLHGTSASASSSSSSRTAGETDELLPMYDPQSEFAKKEKLQMKFAENAVHMIPLVLVLCAAILWFCSNPDVDMVSKDGPILAGIQGLTIDGDMDVAHSKTGLLDRDLDALKQEKEMSAAERFLLS